MSQSTVSIVAVTIAAILGIACCIVGGVLYAVFPDMAKKMIEESLPLSSGSESAKLWEDSPVPVYWKVHFFNITNPDEVRQNEKPNLQEVGPFVFRLVKSKKDLDWKNGTVFFNEHRMYLHEPGSDINTKINHFNAIYMATIENMLSDPLLGRLDVSGEIVKGILEDVFASKPNIALVETHTVYEILFGGFESDVVAGISSLTTDRRATLVRNLIAGQMATKMKAKFPEGVFGLYYRKNDTFQHSYEIKTGESDVQELAQIIQYDHKTSMDKTWGDNSYCNTINGTDATMFGPGVSKQATLYAFTAELCRSVHFEYEKEVSVQDIVAYKFILPIALLQDKDLNPDNACFCHKDFCKTGTVKIGKDCPDGTGGIVFSAPHFYSGNESLLDAVDGLNPKQELHETYVNVEPNTGVTLGAAKRLQINVHLRKLDFPLLGNAEERVVPIAWVEESGEIDSESAKTFRSKVTNKLDMYPKLFIGLIAVGGFFVLLSVVVCIYKQRR